MSRFIFNRPTDMSGYAVYEPAFADANSALPSITSVSSVINGSTVTINGNNLTDATVDLILGAIVVAQSNVTVAGDGKSLTFSIVRGVPYGEVYLRVTTPEGVATSIVNFQPQTGWAYTTMVDPIDTTEDSIWHQYLGAAPEDGDQVAYQTLSVGGGVVQVESDGKFVITGGTATDSFQAECFSEGEWQPVATITLVEPSSAVVESVGTDNKVAQFERNVPVVFSGFSGAITAVSFNDVALDIVSQDETSLVVDRIPKVSDVAGVQTLTFRLSDGSRTATLDVEVNITHPISLPTGQAKSNSILNGQKYTAGSCLRVIKDFDYFTMDFAEADLRESISTLGVADAGYDSNVDGTDTAQFTILDFDTSMVSDVFTTTLTTQ